MITDETVHLHLEQRVAQRLLARFRAQGFIHNDISRACLAQVSDSIPRVDPARPGIAVRAAGPNACTRSWSQSPHGGPSPTVETGRSRHTRARPSGAASGCSTTRSATARTSLLVAIANRLLASSAPDVAELLPQLERRAEELSAEAAEKLRERGRRESALLHETLVSQRQRVRQELERHTRRVPATHARIRR